MEEERNKGGKTKGRKRWKGEVTIMISVSVIQYFSPQVIKIYLFILKILPAWGVNTKGLHILVKQFLQSFPRKSHQFCLCSTLNEC